jgi:hypothetical protein
MRDQHRGMGRKQFRCSHVPSSHIPSSHIATSQFRWANPGAAGSSKRRRAGSSRYRFSAPMVQSVNNGAFTAGRHQSHREARATLSTVTSTPAPIAGHP